MTFYLVLAGPAEASAQLTATEWPNDTGTGPSTWYLRPPLPAEGKPDHQARVFDLRAHDVT